MNKLDELRSALARQGVDGLIVTDEFNRRYLSGFHGTAGSLLVSAKQQILAVDSRYTEQAQTQAQGWEVRDITLIRDWFPRFVKELGLNKLGFEANSVTVATLDRYRKAFKDAALSCELVSTLDLVENMRICKREDEIRKLERAAEIGDAAFVEASATIRAGDTEREVAIRFEQAARRLGADGLSFPPIVGTGANGAMPHHAPDDTRIQDGDTIVFDCGVIYAGYCSDLTRTIALGEPSARAKEIYAIVARAQNAGIERLKAGLKGSDVDRAAREVIEQAGYGELFGHGTGHGVGLQVHENPYVARTSENILDENSVVTVEPGIYIRGEFGVRIEDMLLVTKDGSRSLSKAPKVDL